VSAIREIALTVNGQPRRGRAEPRTSLVDFLRDALRLTGTHVGCEHGVCGACTVLVDGEPVRGCLLLAVQADGARVETVEGLAADPAQLNPLQAEFVRHHGVQCGFCIGGILMSLTAALRENPRPVEEEIRDTLAGHLCRCTGYQGMVDAVLALVASTTAPVTGRSARLTRPVPPPRSARPRAATSARRFRAARTRVCSPAAARSWTTSRCRASPMPRWSGAPTPTRA
jgi:carbon-monoxide dehydrogenase small subunit